MAQKKTIHKKTTTIVDQIVPDLNPNFANFFFLLILHQVIHLIIFVNFDLYSFQRNTCFSSTSQCNGI